MIENAKELFNYLWNISVCDALESSYNLTTWTAMESGSAVKIGAGESDDCDAETQE